MWSKGNPPTLGMGMWSWCGTIGSAWRFLRRKTESPYNLATALLSTRADETLTWKNTFIPMFIEALFTIAKIWKCPSSEWIKKMWCTHTHAHNTILLSRKKQWNITICRSMGGPRDCFTKWSKSDRESQVSYDITYMWNLKYDKNELIDEKETDSQTQKTNLWLPKEKGGEG